MGDGTESLKFEIYCRAYLSIRCFPRGLLLLIQILCITRPLTTLSLLWSHVPGSRSLGGLLDVFVFVLVAELVVNSKM